LPNKMFDAAGADVTTDVIVFRKYNNDAREKIEELAQQNPDKLHECKVLWDEFLVGGYFKGDGLHNVLGRTEMGRGRFGDVEKVVSDDSIANISKLLKRLPDSRIDWAGLNAAPTTAIQYQDGDSIAVAGRTMTYKNGVFVQDPPSEKDAEIVQIGENLFSPLQAVNTEAKWEDAVRFNKALQDKADYKNIPLWIKISVQNISSAIPEADRSAVFDVLKTAFALQDVVNQHVTEEPFNYAEVYPVLSTAIRLNVKNAKKIPATVPKQVREVASLLGIWYITKTQSFRDRWNGTSLSEVVINELRPTQKYERAKYEMADDSGFVPLDHLTEVMGEGFDPLESDEWCVSSDGKGVMSSDDFYSGNYAEFLERNRQDIASIGDPVLREKLVRQRQNAQDRLVKTDISALTIDLNSPLVSIERKVEFLRKYVHSGFSVLANGDTPEIVFDGKKTKGMSDNDLRNMKRFADYLKRGVLSTLTSEAEIAANRDIDKVRIERLKKLITSTNQKFDAWCKSNTGVQDGLRRQFDNPKNIYFKEVDDNSPLEIDGLNPAFQPHDYQNGAIRRYAKRMSGILGFDVGLGKTFTSLATIQHVQSIGVKKKTIFAVPNAVLTNWRKEAIACYKSTDDCLFVGLDVDANGVGTLNSSNYARDLNTILENKHRKIFVTYEALGMIPMREGTIEEYERHLSLVDQSYNSSDTKSKSASIIKEGKLKGVTDAGAKGSAAVPFFEDMGIDSIVVDEGHCFPAGTLVDGIPIEKLKIGDMVRSLNHETGAVEFRKITDAMSRQAPSMVCVTLLDGQEIYCTHNHPFFTKDRGYVKAENLSVDDVVLKSKCNHEKTQTNGAMQPMLIGIPALARSGGESERRDQGVLHEEMLRTGIAGQDADPSTVRGVCDGVRVKPHSELEVREGSCDELFLLKVLPNIEHASNISANGDVEKESRECECRTQRNDGAWQLAANASGGGEEQVDENFARNSQGQAVKSSGRERATSIGGAFDAVEGVGFSMASGVRGENKDAERERIPVMLQARSGESVNSSRDRGGREVSLFESGSDEGFKEDGVFVGVGVASVAFLERGSDGRFGGVCGDGLVYDITVDGNHNFFAEGILVHNCFKNSKETVEFKAAKFLSDPATSNRGLDMQMKTWYIRGKSKLNDGALILTATPITNSPLEIYSMLTLAIGEDEVNRRMGGVRGSDAFMQTFCSIGEEEVVSLAGVERLQRVFTGLQNTNLLRSMLNQVANIKSARQVDLKIPDAEEISTSVELPASDVKELQRMQAIYSAASKMARGKDVLPQEEQMVLAYQEISREPIDLIGHPFNFINKVSKLIADPELARQTTVYVFGTAQAELANKVVTEFNAKKFTEERNRPSLAQDQASIISRKIKKSGADSGENDVEVLKVLIVAKIVGEKIVIDTEDIDTQNKFLKIAEKSKLNLDVTISPKLAVFLENFKQEDASPRGKGKAKQLIFCDMLSLHNKIKILLKNRCGIDPSKIIIVNGVTISDAADMQDTQDGFNAEGDENRYRVVIANKKAEVGVNYQKGTQAIHHLTVGWTPDSIHQRNGRGVRQGNYVGKVTIYHYDADGTFDEYKRGIVSKKADWIGELVSDEGGNSVKIAGGISNSDIEMLAEAAGSAEGMRKVREKIANREMV
ncbi:MAG: DEAD/DEAH box helicase family protein, partial [Burkholderiaceae bacterium]|nr:DEAD/DEAH box helicase family protein [Burkholderiaceae bacterium]